MYDWFRFDNDHWRDRNWFDNHRCVNHRWLVVVSDDWIPDNVLVVLISIIMYVDVFTMVVNDRRLMIRIRFDVCWLVNDHRFHICWLVDDDWLDISWFMDDNRLDVCWFNYDWFVWYMDNRCWGVFRVTYDVLVVLISILVNVDVFAMVMDNRRLMVWIRLDIRWLMYDDRLDICRFMDHDRLDVSRFMDHDRLDVSRFMDDDRINICW